MSSAFDLAQTANTTTKQLTEIWDQLGETSGERDRVLQQLCNDVVALFSNMLIAQRARVADATTRVDMYLTNIRSISHELEESPPAGIIDLANVSLLQRVEKLKNCLESLQLKRSKRLEHMHQSHQALQDAWDALEFSAAERDPRLAVVDEANLGEARLAAYDLALGSARTERRSRESVIEKHSTRIAELFDTLCEQVNASSALDAAVLDRSVAASLGCGRRVIEQLAARLSALEAKREDREERIKTFAVDITALWDRLNVSEEERDDFYEAHQGLGESVLAACASELTRLRALKQARMRGMIDEVRQRIATLWQKLGFSEHQRGMFYRSFFLVNDRNDDAFLEAHEAEERMLEDRLVELTPILAAIDEREGLMEEKRQMDLLASDPERLTSRRRDPGRLLREEKFRTRFAKLLPVCEQRLETLIGNWEVAHSDEAPFLYQGVAYRAELDTVHAARRANTTHYAASTAASTAAIVQQTPTGTRARAHTTPAVAVAPSTLSRAQTMALNTPRTPLSSMPVQQMNTRSRAAAAAGDAGDAPVANGIGAKGRAATTGLRVPTTTGKARR